MKFFIFFFCICVLYYVWIWICRCVCICICVGICDTVEILPADLCGRLAWGRLASCRRVICLRLDFEACQCRVACFLFVFYLCLPFLYMYLPLYLCLYLRLESCRRVICLRLDFEACQYRLDRPTQLIFILLFYLWVNIQLRMLSSVTLDWQVTKIVFNSGSQLSVSVVLDWPRDQDDKDRRLPPL